MLGALNRRLVWLATIDMETLAEPTNLLAAILARVSEAAWGRGAEERDVAGLLESRSESRDTLLHLQHLETNVALAWDGNLAARGGQLDPDSFAIEVMRTERARLSLNRSIREALDDLARKVFGKDGRDGVSNPLFVLSVDDFDLNPLRCLDLLRALRMVSVPRLFTVVLGDVKVAEMLFNLKLSGDFARLAGRSGREDLLSLSAEDVRGLAGEVAANAIRKLLPPAQIIRLEHMTPAEALKYAPARDKPAPTLYGVLAASPLRVNARYQLAYRMANLAEFFQLQTPNMDLPESALERAEQPAPVGPGAEIARGVYTGSLVFSNSPRRIADLWHELELHLSDTARETLAKKELPREPAASYDHVRAIVGVFANHCQRSIAEDTQLPDRGRRTLLHAIRKNRYGYWELDTQAYTVKSKTGTAYAFGIPPESDKKGKGKNATPRKLEPPYQRVVVYRTNGWSIRVPADKPKKAVELDDATAAALIAFHDLIILPNLGTQGAGIWEEMTRRRRLEWDSPATEWRCQGRRVHIKWPSASWSTFREYDFLISAWRRVINWLDQESPPLVKTLCRFEALAFAWIDLNLMVLDPWAGPPEGSGGLGKTPTWKHLAWPAGFHAPETSRRKLEPNWPQLINILGEFVQEYYPVSDITGQREPKSHPSLYRALDWLTQMAVFLMPETLGTSLRETIDKYFPAEPKEDSTLGRGPSEVLGLKALYDYWRSSAEDIRSHRAQKFAYLRSRGAVDSAEYLMTAEPPACLQDKKDVKYTPTEDLIEYFQEEIGRNEKGLKGKGKVFSSAAQDGESTVS
jgi:hypothetical protein